ncbi:AAA family ATPase [Pannus brasiliensis CCIBt3594]|uniref:gluconokinase n=1 Tax=Pannus brasiliensis CCIBt3594 TaxID=1427578 RepID=A0AAW9QSJ4_9CHRO
MDTAKLIETLTNPDFYPHPVTSPVKVIQTHASIVFLTGDLAYKIKKPVDYHFLDFSTLEKRKECIDRELSLNQSTAPDIYREVLPITESAGKVTLNGDGEIIEYVLKMNQFPQECLLSQRFDRGELTEAEIESLGKKIARFHQRARTDEYITRFGELETIEQAFEENYRQTEKYIDTVQIRQQFEETKTFTDNFFLDRGDWLRERQEQGKIRECHGDLHLNNMCLWRGEIQLFDRVEFNESFRFVDTMYDVAFTAMDLTARGRPDFANLFLNTYLERVGDWEGLKVLSLYLSRQSYVRAKVNSFLLDGDTFSETIRETARQYYHLAWEYTRPRSGRLIVLSGLSGSGKSTVAREIAKKLDGIRIRSDAVRKHLAGIDLDDRGSIELYTPEMSARTFDRLAELARILLPLGYTVILDAKYDRAIWREPLRALAGSIGVPFHIVHCHAPLSVLLDRIEKRIGDISDATTEVLLAQIEKTEPFTDSEQPYLISVDTTRSNWSEGIQF